MQDHDQSTTDRLSVLEENGLTQDLTSVLWGQSVDGQGSTHLVIDPSTGLTFAQFRDSGQPVVRQSVDAAQVAFSSWADLPGHRRGAVLLAIAQRLRANAAPLARLESLDTGKPLSQAANDVEASARYFEFYGGAADKIYGETIEQATGFAYTRREPVGVVGVITPWNSPLAQLARSVAPALAAGNTVVAKPSELTPLSSLALARLAIEAGLPSGALNVILGTGASTGSAISKDSGISHISFTGSVETGIEVGKAAAERVVEVSLELGGKSATIVFPDADLEAAATAGVGAVVRNAGQSCFATTRLIVHRSIHDELIERMRIKFSRLSVGSGLQDRDLGPLVSQAQRERVHGFVERAVAQGATLETPNDGALSDGAFSDAAFSDAALSDGALSDGALPEAGYFYRPVLLSGVTNDMEVAQNEVFGPVQTVLAFDEEDEAIRIANDSVYGLAAGVFTQSISRAHRVAHQLDAGQVQVNRYPLGGVDTPFGGTKASGIGREKGLEALRHYTRLKTVIIHLDKA